MWFRPEQIVTSALKRVKKYNRNKLEVEMAQILLTIVDQKELSEICFSLSDIQEWLQKKGFRGYDSNSIRKVLQDNWKLTPSENSNSYIQYRLSSDGSIYEYNYKGRYYKLSQNEVLNVIPDVTENGYECVDENAGDDTWQKHFYQILSLLCRHRQSFHSFQFILIIGRRNSFHHPYKNKQGQGKHQPRNKRHPKLR